MGIKSRGNFKTMSKDRYNMINWDSEDKLCSSCAGPVIEKLIGDEVIEVCEECGMPYVGE